MIVTIDGPGGSGKSTVSRIVARRLGLPYLNSGFIYRAVTLLVLDDGGDFTDRERIRERIQSMDLRFLDAEDRTRVFLGEREVTQRLKDPDVTAEIHRVANDGYLRSLLLDLQRSFALPAGVVAEGRDMGTVIFPQAEHKFYLDASPEERARRQQRELEAAGHAKSYADVLADVLRRDRHDREREHAPLRVPHGAVVIPTDDLSIKDVAERILKKMAPAPGGAA
jgi:cytidylate kinase